jgi:hypothetical protein
MRQTPLYDAHRAAGGRLVDYVGWALPINYGSQIDEHHQVRNDAGVFDVSHMTVVDLRGPRVRKIGISGCVLAQGPGMDVMSSTHGEPTAGTGLWPMATWSRPSTPSTTCSPASSTMCRTS